MPDSAYLRTQPKRLTVARIEAAQPDHERYEISDGGSALRLIVFPTGSKSWALRFRVRGRLRKLTLGRYPEMTLKDARLAAGEALAMAAKGGDPAEAKQQAKAEERDTVARLVPLHIEQWQKPRNRTWQEVDRSLHRVLVPAFGAWNVRDIKRRDLIRALGGCNRRVLANVKRFFSWCVEQDLIEASPAAAIRPADPLVARDRVLADDEVRAFLKSLPELGEPWAAILELLLLTGQRRSEVSEAVWSEIDLAERGWNIPKERAKNGRAHFVPLSVRAHAIIDTLPSRKEKGFLFPADRGGTGTASGFTRVKRRLDKLMLGHLRKDDPDAELTPWRIHDLRRTAATGMARLGHPPHVVEAVLNHASGRISGVAAIYNRFNYADEKRTALQDWARFLQDTNINPVESPADAPKRYRERQTSH